MPGNVNATVIWEDNPDTSINATNLSKTIDFISESKFIEYTEAKSDYAAWADYALQTKPSVPLPEYVDKIIYEHNSDSFFKGRKNQDVYEWLETGFSKPIKKLLKIKAHTKISMSYITTAGVYKYINFDVGTTPGLFSVESLITTEDLSPNLKYNIYLYNTSSLGDNAQIKIVSEYDDAANTGGWKQGPPDPGSPTGNRVIAIRKIGGFKTNASNQIDKDSLWDLSTYNSEIISEKYKILDSSGVRTLTASDIPVVNNSFVSKNVEGALADVKVNVDQFYKDLYWTADRYGVELEYSIFSPNEEDTLVPIDINGGSLTIPIRITSGYINVVGSKVAVTNPIYLGDSRLQVMVNNYMGKISGLKLGAKPDSPYQTSTSVNTLYPGLWRVYINSEGTIIFREGDQFAPQYSTLNNRKGWYYTSDSSRCIGKFRIRSDNYFYVEKLSITNTFDVQVPKNTVHMFHGTMCPDGLYLCDGLWHDTTGKDTQALANMPLPSNTTKWTNSWWEQTPKMFGKTVKMFDEDDFSVANNSNQLTVDQPRLTWISDQLQNYAIIQSGSSDDCGDEGGADNHTHVIDHLHSSSDSNWDLNIISSMANLHNHQEATVQVGIPDEGEVRVLPSNVGESVSVVRFNHTHPIHITEGGNHGHDSFSGNVGRPSNLNSGQANNWAPYKEFVMCIKK